MKRWISTPKPLAGAPPASKPAQNLRSQPHGSRRALSLWCWPSQVAVTVPPIVVRLVSSAPGWRTLLLTFLIGAATTLVAQLIIQFYAVPKVETRKRREDRWERDVRELGDLLTTELRRRAYDAHVEQGKFRDLRQRESESGLDQSKITQDREQQGRTAQEAAWAFGDLLSTRVDLLTGRIRSINPKAQVIREFHEAAGRYRSRTIIAHQVRPGDDDRTEEAFEEAWVKEGDARVALTKQLQVLEVLPHPPRARRSRR